MVTVKNCLFNILVRLVLIRERNQELIFLVYPQPAGRLNRNIISIIFTFSPVMYSFHDKILFSESSSL